MLLGASVGERLADDLRQVEVRHVDAVDLAREHGDGAGNQLGAGHVAVADGGRTQLEALAVGRGCDVAAVDAHVRAVDEASICVDNLGAATFGLHVGVDGVDVAGVDKLVHWSHSVLPNLSDFFALFTASGCRHVGESIPEKRAV